MTAQIKEWKAEVDRRERQKQQNNMTNYKQEFINWLEADTSRKENLTHWEVIYWQNGAKINKIDPGNL